MASPRSTRTLNLSAQGPPILSFQTGGREGPLRTEEEVVCFTSQEEHMDLWNEDYRDLRISRHTRRGQSRHCCLQRRHIQMACMVSATVLAVLWMAHGGSKHLGKLRGLTDTKVDARASDQLQEQGFCGHVEHDVEFHTHVSLWRVRRVYSSEMCCSACEAHPECGAWTWGKRSGIRGLSNECYLRKLDTSRNPVRQHRPGLVSGIVLHRLEKHGLVAGFLRETEKGKAPRPEFVLNNTCTGQVKVGGHGLLSVIGAKWHTPGMKGTQTKVSKEKWSITPSLRSRAYLGEACTGGKPYNVSQYATLQLLGRTFRYTTDLSGVGCGCNAQLHLIPMRWNMEKSKCQDYFCGPAQAGICGVACSAIRLQDANQYSWSTAMHVHDDTRGRSAGYGGGISWVGRRDWNESQYGPGSDCIDTSWPFHAAVSFPVDDKGILKAVEVSLTQDGHDCKLDAVMDKYWFKGRNGLAELSAVLDQGVTPVLSYWGSAHLMWLDGLGKDGKGPCVQDTPAACPESMMFYDFLIDWSSKKLAVTASTSPLDVAIGAIHREVTRQEMSLRRGELTNMTAMKDVMRTTVDCQEDCDTEPADIVKDSVGDGEDDEPVKIEDVGEEVKERNTEWEVIFDRIHVRKAPHFNAHVLRHGFQGEILIGQRVGDWVELINEPGWAAVRKVGKKGGAIFMKERNVDYKKVTADSCTSRGMFSIEDESTCRAAAWALGYLDTFLNIYNGVSDKPFGCYVKDGQVFMETNPANKDNKFDNGRMPICCSMPYPTTTTTTTTATTSTTTMDPWLAKMLSTSEDPAKASTTTATTEAVTGAATIWSH